MKSATNHPLQDFRLKETKDDHVSDNDCYKGVTGTI